MPDGRTPLIATCNREAARWVMHPHPFAVISITDPTIPGLSPGSPVDFPPCDTRIAVLPLEFGDFHEKHFGIEHEGVSVKHWAMTPGHGRNIAEFVSHFWPRVSLLLIHCEAGVSRSASMAVAIADHYGIERHSIEPVHRKWDAQPLNPWVYALTREAMRGRHRARD